VSVTTDMFTDWVDDLSASLTDDGLHPDDLDMVRSFAEVLWTFHWGRDGGDAEGLVELVVLPGTDRLGLRLEVWVIDNDDPSPRAVPSHTFTPVHRGDVAEQVRRLVHAHLVHEADEQLWFGDDRPFHPHHGVTA
jgi:hypothetical protein